MPSAAQATDFTWTGGGMSPNWSVPANWGGLAPSGTVGALSFPATAGHQAGFCAATDDVSGLSASSLGITVGVSAPGTAPPCGYSINATPGTALTLRSGLSVTLDNPGNLTSYAEQGPEIRLPIVLGGPNTWTIGANTDVAGNISGVSQGLTIDIPPRGGNLYLQGTSNEVGPVTINGQPSSSTNVFLGTLPPGGGSFGPGDLNGSDRNSVALAGSVQLSGAGRIGPLSATAGSSLQPGNGPGDAATLAVQGPLTLDSTASVQYPFLTPGGGAPVAGTDYPTITSAGAAALGGARLVLTADCNQALGTTYTLVNATGGVSGTFDAVDGAILVANPARDASCVGAAPPSLRINYTANTVTATVVAAGSVTPPPSNTSPPTISGRAVEGQTLTEAHGTWTGAPTVFGYQWEDCDRSGGACTPIAGATGQTYTLGGPDVGHTVRVLESATNAGGTSAAAPSAPTAVVVPAPPANTAPPSISGRAVQGQTLTETHGAWTGAPTAYAYQWEDCDGSGGACSAIAGATAQTYTLTAADVGHTIRVVESATNTGGTSAAPSAPTAVVAALPATFVWTGASLGSFWSDASNWALGAPRGTVGALRFPTLAPGSCAVCYASRNDVIGLTAGALSIDDGAPYLISGNALTLGGGGITANTTNVNNGQNSPTLGLPLTLAAPQTWSISTAGGSSNFSGLTIAADVSGAASALTMDLSQTAELNLRAADVEVGPVTITGPGTLPGLSANPNGSVSLDAAARLNATNGNPVHVIRATLGGRGTVGPLTATGGRIEPFGGTLSVAGGITLDSASEVQLEIDGPGAADSSLSATGRVDLAGASLRLGSTDCRPGQAHTLITTTGSLVGRFAGLPGTTTVPILAPVACPAQDKVTVFYTPHSVIVTTLGGAGPTGVTTGPALDVGDTSATLTGTIDSGNQPVDWYFSIINPDGSPTSTTKMTLPAGAGATPVSFAVTGLRPGTSYQYHLVAARLSGQTASGADLSFTTTVSCQAGAGGPGISVGSVRFGRRRAVFFNVASSSPEVHIVLVFGHDTSYGLSVDGDPSGTTVAHGAFTPGSTYHYRAIAYTPQGESCSPDQTTTVEQGLQLVTAPVLAGPGTATPVPGKTLYCGGQNTRTGEDRDSRWLYNGAPVANSPSGKLRPPYSNEPALTPWWLRDGRQVLSKGRNSYVIRDGDIGHYISCVQFADNGWDFQPTLTNFFADQSLGVLITHYNGVALWVAKNLKKPVSAYDYIDSARTIIISHLCAVTILVAGAGEGLCVAEIVAGEVLSLYESFLVDLVDPPDPHYRSLALPRPFHLARAASNCPGPGAARCRLLVAAGNRVIAATERAASILEAMAVAANRFSSARSARDFDAVGAQLASRKVYEGLLVAATRSRESARGTFERLLERAAGRAPRNLAGAFHYPPLPGALVHRLERDGVDPRTVLPLLERDIRPLRRPGTLRATARRPVPTAALRADYQSVGLDDVGELLHALRRQSALSRPSYAQLLDELGAVRMRCTPAERAVAMEQLRRDLRARLAPRPAAFMDVALAPLLSSRAPGLTRLPGCPAH